MRLASLFVLFTVMLVQFLACGGQQWYKVNERGGVPGETNYPGSVFDIWSLFEDREDPEVAYASDEQEEKDEQDFAVYFGGAILRRQPTLVKVEDFAAWAKLVQGKVAWLQDQDTHVLQGREYELYSCIDFAAPSPVPYAVEVAQLMVNTQSFANNEWRDVVLGRVVALEVEVGEDAPEQERARYRVILNVDQAERVSVTHFTAMTEEGAASGSGSGSGGHPIFNSAASPATVTQTEEDTLSPSGGSAAGGGFHISGTTCRPRGCTMTPTAPSALHREDATLGAYVSDHGPDVVYFQEV